MQSAWLSPISSSSSLALGRFALPVRLLAGVVVSALLMVSVPISRVHGAWSSWADARLGGRVALLSSPKHPANGKWLAASTLVYHQP